MGPAEGGGGVLHVARGQQRRHLLVAVDHGGQDAGMLLPVLARARRGR